jgi:hypothetical protein
MAEIKDSPEKNDRISLTEIVSISTLLFAVSGAVIYASGVYFWNTILDEMKISSYQFPPSVYDVSIVGWVFFY